MSNDSRNAHFASNSRRNVLSAAVSPLLEMLEGRSLFTANAIPTAVAGGPYSVNEGSSVLISGLNSTDSDGTVATYQWDTNYSAGKGFKNRLTGSTWTFTADDSGTRNIALRVIDNNGDASVVSTATINIADVAPTITLTAPTTADEASPVSVAWSYTDPGLSDTVSAWNIDWGDDTTSTYAGTATAATHTYDENGSYTMTLTATQTDATTSVTHAITVNNVTPIVNVTSPHSTIDEGEMAQVGFTSPNRGGTLDGWTIDWGDGNTEALSASRSVAAHLYADSGNYTATVFAQEPDGGNGSGTINFTVNNVAATITETGVPSTGNEGSAITVGSTVSDPGQNDTHTYGWTVYRNGSQFSLPGGTTLDGTSFTFTPTDNGSYVVRLSVMDDEGAVATINSSAIIVANVNPTATITGTPGGTIHEGAAVALTANPSDVGSEDTFSYAWSVTKDNNAFSLPFATATSNAGFTFTPTDNGSYVATVVVTDKDNGTVSVSTAAITVDNVAPTNTVTGEPVSSPEGTAITVGAHPVDAGTADTFTYSWSVTKDGNPYNVGVSPINQAAFTFTPKDNGDYIATVVVTDDDGDSVTTASATIPVTNVAPTATVSGDTAGDEGSGLNFSVTPADVGALDTTFTYAWSVTKGGNAYVTNLGATNAANFSFTPVDDGAYVVTVVTTDKDGDSVSTSTNVTVANVKPVATITGAPSTSPEATQISLGSTVTDTGTADTFTYAWSVAKGSNAYNVGNAVTTNSTFAFTPSDNGTYVVTLVVTDNGGAARTVSTSAITVTNVNPTVSVSGEPVAPITEGGEVDLAAAGADVSTDDTLTYAWTITKDGHAYTPLTGTVVNDANLSFVPTDNGSYIASVVVTDDDTGTATASSTTILVINADPVATITGAPASSPEGSELNLNASVADDGVDDTHTYDWTVTKDSVPVDLTGIISDAAAFTYTPADNGDYVISLTVTDNDNGTSITSANLTVTNVAPAPVISGNNSVNEDAPITLTVAANDPGTADTQTYLWSVTKGGNAYTAHLGATNTSSFTFTPNVQGSYVVSCVVTDKDAAHTTATKTITVNNIAPIAAITGMPTGPRGEGSPITLHGAATDSSGETGLTYAWTVKRGGVSFALPGGTVTNAHDFEFTPTDNGLYRVTLAVTDSGGLIGTSTTSNMVVTNALPDAALSGEPSGPIDEGTPVSLHVDAADPGAEDTLSYLWSVTKDGSPFALPNGTATTGTNFTFTPTNQGTYIAKVVVTDDDGGPANVSTAGIVVNNVIPVAAITGEPITSVGEGSTITLGSTATDPGTADVLTYSWSVEKDGSLFELPSALNTAGSTFGFVPTDEGAYVVSLVVSDGTDIVTTSTDVLTVDNVAPTGTISGPTTANEGAAVTLTANATDAGVNDVLTYAWSVVDADGNPVTLDSNVATDGTSFSYTPPNNGTYAISCDVADGTSITTLTQTVTVANVAPAVSLTGVTATGAEGTAITVGSTATDVAADTLTYGWIVYRNGDLYTLDNTVDTDGTSLTFTPSDDGSYVVRLSVTDGDTGITTKNSSAIAVANVAPVVVLDTSADPTEGEDVTVSSTVTDAGSDDQDAGFTYAWTAKRGNTTVATGTDADFTFTPSVHGSYAVTSIVTDKDGLATTTHSTVNVANVAPSNVAIEGSLDELTEGDDVSIGLSADDVSGDTLVYTWSVMDGDNVFASGVGTNVAFTAERGDYQLVVTATDTAHESATDTFDFTVANLAPTADLTAPANTVLTGAAANLLLNIADVPANQALNVSWDFGDGTTAAASYTGTQALSRKHTYTTHGVYTVTATITDGVDNTVVTSTVSVGEATMVADPMDSTKTALVVNGTPAADTINVIPTKGGRYGVTVNGYSLGNTFAPTGHIYVYGNGGSNTISVDGNANAVVYAGVGASTVTTGSGNDIIVGSAGIDRLNGGAGRDVIIGAAGADIIHGGDGEDLIIAGSTSKMNDNATNNALLTQWTANTTIGTRRTAIKNLFGRQLVADAGSNQLYGDAGNDWMIFGSDKLKDASKTDLLN